MSNFSTATEATAAALNSSSSAARENARYMESIEARVTAVSAAFQKMSTAVVDSDLVKGILDIVKAMAEFGSTDFGAAVTQFVLLSGLSWGGLQLLGQSILPAILKSFGVMPAAIKAVGVAINSSLPYIAAITAAIIALVEIVKFAKKTYDEFYPSVENAKAAMESAQESLEAAQNDYDGVRERLEKLNNTPFEDRTDEINAEIERLELLRDYYQQVLEIRKYEAAYKTATAAAAYEREGFSTGRYTASWNEIRKISDAAWWNKWQDQYGIKRVTEEFESYEAAVIAATTATIKLKGATNGKPVIEFTNAEETGKKLEKNFEVEFEEIKLTVKEAQEKYKSILQLFERLEDSPDSNFKTQKIAELIDEVKDLDSITGDYGKTLQFLSDNGVILSDQQKEYLSIYNDLTNVIENHNEQLETTDDTIEEEIKKYSEAADVLQSYAQNLINAANAYQIFKDRLSETGDYDDAFKGFSSILGEVISEFEAGQIGSQKFLTGIELLTGQTMTSAEAVEYMTNNLDTLKLLFGDAESGGTGLITALQNLGIAELDADGNLKVAINDFASVAEQLGISEGALYSLIEALRVMGVDFNYNAQDILDNIAKLGVGIENGTIDFKEYAIAAKEAGMSNDEIIAISNILSNVEGIELINVAEGIAALGNESDNAADGAEGLQSDLTKIGQSSSSISSTSDAVGDLAGNLNSAANNASNLASSLSSISNFKAPSLAGLINGVSKNAKGTSYAKEGMSLVNEEGAELIQSDDKAYIAGGGLPTITHLHEGDKVYTADETKNILGNNKINGEIQSHVKGTDSTGFVGIGGNNTGFVGISGIKGTVSKEILSQIKRGNYKSPPSSSPSSSKSSSKSSSDIKKEFDEWLKAKKHALAMDEITEEEYYKALEEMNDKYFKGKKEYQDEYWKYQEEIYSWEKKQEEERAKAAAKAYEDEFKTWLNAQDHALAMDQITQEEYYTALEQMNDKYFKDKEEYQDEYWRYEEKIYAWRKRQAEEEARAQEQSLKDQIDLEKKLNDLAKAQASRVKVFENGQFRYVSDREALAKAQEALSSYGNGTLSANGGLSLVGENGAEMRVLNKGDGIIPANITRNLWNWGAIDPSVFASKSNNNSIYNFDISNLDLPNVHNATDFVSGLKSFALQYIAQRG